MSYGNTASEINGRIGNDLEVEEGEIDGIKDHGSQETIQIYQKEKIIWLYMKLLTEKDKKRRI